MLFAEQVGMCACIEEQKMQFSIILFPNHKPVWLDMALPLPLSVSGKFMRFIRLREFAIVLK